MLSGWRGWLLPYHRMWIYEHFPKTTFFLGVLGVFHQQFRRRWNRKAQIRWNRIETDCTSKQTAIQIHPFSSDSHSEIHIHSVFISLETHFPLIKGWIMSVIMIIHILTTLSATQLHHYAYEMQMKYLRKIWIINALHIIRIMLVGFFLVVVDGRLNVKCKQIWIWNLGGDLWLIFFLCGGWSVEGFLTLLEGDLT